MAKYLANDKPSEADHKPTSCANSTTTALAALASEIRAAALRSFAARLAHRFRNPLAAIHAACTNLREETADPEHIGRLDLVLEEVANMLTLISTEIQAVVEPGERPSKVSVTDEISSIVDIIRAAFPNAPMICVQPHTEVTCILPRTAFHVAIYGLLEYLISELSATSISIELQLGKDRLQVHFTVAMSEGRSNATLDTVTSNRLASVDQLHLQIAERFARDVHGRLKQWTLENGTQKTVLEILCIRG
ncbi:MAG: hypothetical protein KDI63_13630 [Gammaproteobacteria bacterium]|nr:hypothetical protein [Gammaproteobacteria bacterium]